MTNDKLARWLHERLENCRRIARTKTQPSDYAGWLEDAQYFEAAVKLAEENERLRSDIAKLESDLDDADRDIGKARALLEGAGVVVDLWLRKH